MKGIIITIGMIFILSCHHGRIEEQSGTAHGDYLEFANSSNIVIEQLDSMQIENLTNLGLIWGFLKYYHPNIAKGNYNWDYELFKIFPEILKSENNIHRDSIFIEWINGLGKFAENKKEISIKKEIKLAPDLGWIESSGFSNELTSLLIKVKNSKRHRKHHYVGYYFTGNPKFKNEEPYPNMLYPNAGFRLLALYRYWNIIQYFFPYKNLIECDWKEVLKEFVPKIVNTNNGTEYALTILELIERIHDSHAITLNHNYSLANHFGKFSASVELTFIENQPVVTGFYNENLGRDTGMEIGDVITKINHVSVAEIIDGLLKYTPASNYPGKLRNLAKNMLRTNDSIIHVEFIRDNKPQNKVLRVFSDDKHDLYHVYSKEKDTCLEFIDDGIAYLDYSVLENKHIPKIWKKIKNTKGLILDIRNGTSGDFPVLLFCQYLLPTKTPFFLKSTTKHYSIPGLFTIEKGYNVGRKNKNYYKGKIIILVNKNTQSTGEFQTMAYRVHPNAVVVGSATAGADGNVSKFYLPGGIETWISGIGVYYPDGSETQRIGIVPDVEVKPTVQGIRERRDEVLEKAIELVNR